MAPKNSFSVSKGRTLAEPSFAQSTYQTFTSKDNRSVISAIGLFAVRVSVFPDGGRNSCGEIGLDDKEE
jgi:hypothetical protein